MTPKIKNKELVKPAPPKGRMLREGQRPPPPPKSPPKRIISEDIKLPPTPPEIRLISPCWGELLLGIFCGVVLAGAIMICVAILISIIIQGV